MNTPKGPLVLALTCIAVLVISWITITAMTTPARAVACGVALCVAAGIFIWFAKTTRFAIARGVICVGATALAAPLAAVEAATNEALYAMFQDESQIANNVLEMDRILSIGWRNVAIGAGVGLVLIVVGGVMHRPGRGHAD